MKKYNWEKLLEEKSDLKITFIKEENKIYISNTQCKFMCFCGKIFEAKLIKVVSNHTKSCGCLRGRKFQGTEYICKDFFGRLVRGAKQRNIKVNISIEDIENKLIEQNFKCALTNRDLIYGKKPISEYTMSVDRIDSSKGYTKDNIQILHKEVNFCKQSLSQEEFIKLCKEVTNNNNNEEC